MNCPHCGIEIATDLLGAPLAKEGHTPVQQFIAVYSSAFRIKHKADPIVAGMQAAAAKNIVKSLGLDKAKRFAFAYLAMNDAFFLTKQHDLVTMYQNLTKIGVALETGKVTTRADVNQAERRQQNAQAFAGLLEEPKDG